MDDDADFMPWLALTDRDLERAGTLRRFYYQQLQWWLFPIVLAGNGFNMGRAGWTYVIDGLRANDGRKRTYWLDFGCRAPPLLRWRAGDIPLFPRHWRCTRCALH